MTIPKRLRFSVVSTVLVLCVFMILSTAANSAPVTNRPTTLTQPDGTAIHCLVSGDEYYHWFHDANGFVIVQDTATGYYVYAALVNGVIEPTKYVVGSVNPAQVGLVPNIKPAPKVIQEARARMFAMPANETPHWAPHSGELNNVVIFIRFSDDTEYTDQISTYDNIFNGSNPTAITMKNYFTEASYGALTVKTGFYPTSTTQTVVSYKDSHPRGYYMPYSSTNPNGYLDDGGEREQQMLASCISSIKSQIPSSVDVDKDDDGYVDNICFIVKGTNTDWGSVLWPHMWFLYLSASINGARVGNYNLQLSEWIVMDGVGVLSHEMLHSLGSPDFYHYSDGFADPVGSWDVMCGTADPPQHPTAYVKWKYLDWIPSIPEVDKPGVYTVSPVASSKDCCYKIKSPNSTSEYFVVEYRRKTGTYDNQVPGSGLIVYRINPVVEGNADGPPDELYIFRPGGTPTKTGSLNNAFFSAGSGRTEIDDTTDPAATLASGQMGGIAIRGITAAGDTISFSIGSKLPLPVINPVGGTFTRAKAVTLSCTTPTSKVHYTTNGQDPTESDPYVISGETVLIDENCTLKARAYDPSFVESDITSASFKILNMRLQAIKKSANDVEVGIDEAIVTAVFGDEFYVESQNREIGILVKKAGNNLPAGAKVSIVGNVRTDTNGERYIEASAVENNGTGSVEPMILTVKSFGGGDWSYDSTLGSGQRGITGGKGLNNIGLLVRTSGKFRYIDGSTFALNDGSRKELTCVAPSDLTLDPNWDHITVTGISSCSVSGGECNPRLKLKDSSSIKLDTGAMITGMVTGSFSGVLDKLIETSHPYPASYTNTWTITGPPGTAKMRVHFAKMQLENGYDKLYIQDGAGTTVQLFQSSTVKTDVWSSWVTGSTLKMKMVTDRNTQNWGFQMDKYEVDAPYARMPGVTVTLQPGGLSTVTDANGVYFFRALPAGIYTVAPSQSGSTFNPANYSIPVLFGDYVPGQDFHKN